MQAMHAACSRAQSVREPRVGSRVLAAAKAIGREVTPSWHGRCFLQRVTMKAQSNSKPAREQLLAEHRFLDEQYQALLEAARASDLQTLSTLWTGFERRLSAHMAGEERYILALLEPKHPQIVRSLREEHHKIRNLIAKIGVSTDLHAVRLRALEDLGELLRDHAAREDKSIYQMAARQIDGSDLLRFLQLQGPLVN